MARAVAGLMLSDAALLQTVTAALSGAHDVSSVAWVIVDGARRDLGAAGAFVALAEPGGYRMIGAGGLTVPTSAANRMFAADAPLPPREAAVTGRPVVIRTIAERDRRFPAIRAGTSDDHGSFACVPMLGRSGVVGVVNFSWSQEYAVDDVSEAQLLALAGQCAQALERARLYDAEQLARHEAEAALDRLQLLQTLTSALSRAVDGRAVAVAILDVTMRLLGSTGGSVFRIDHGSSRLLLLENRGMSEDDVVPAIELDSEHPAAHVARTSETAPPMDPGQQPGAKSGPVWGPLLLQGRVVGVMGMQGHDRTRMAALDRQFVATVNQLCAQALERAELYDTTADIALTLQRSMLPRRPPTIPGLEVAVRYRPVGGRTVVGGDFYDVFRVGPGRWGVVIGDVSGKGVRAASLTALARYTVRAVAGSGAPPSDVLAALNAAVLDWDDGEDRFCTAAYVEVEPGPHGSSLSLTVGGHPLPVLRSADGTMRAVGSPGMALGLLPLADVNDTALSLTPGDALVLVTDGITEARAPDGTWVEDAVTRALAIGLDDAGEDAEAIADRIERIVLDVQAGRPRDDLAVVVLRAPTGEGHGVAGAVAMSLTLECEARSVAIARRRVAELLRERGDSRGAEMLELLVSEVVTNAIVHAGTAVGVRVALAADRAHVEVTDSSPRLPVRQDARLESLGGRGLLLLDRLAARWGVRRRADGKVVWFDVDLDAHAQQP